jgi:hypothetical protein
MPIGYARDGVDVLPDKNWLPDNVVIEEIKPPWTPPSDPPAEGPA